MHIDSIYNKPKIMDFIKAMLDTRYKNYDFEYGYEYNLIQKHIPTKTENGALSLSTTGNACVNLFFKLTRDSVENPEFYQWIDDAWKEDPLATMRILFQGRDCRGGKGDRAPFIKAMTHIYHKYPNWFYANYSLIPEYGRYLDWFEIMVEIGSPISCIMISIAKQLVEDCKNMYDGKSVSLLAKWIPSEGKHWDKELKFTKALCREVFGTHKVTPFHRQRLRKEFLTPLRAYIDLLETKMCQNEWDTIEFSKVPGVAMHRYKNAFKSHAPIAFEQWIQDVENGKSKVNASTVYPHTLVASMLKHANDYSITEEIRTLFKVADAQWNVLVQEVLQKGTLGNSLVVCDVSGSMAGIPLEVAIALGLLISTVAPPPFQNALITFSESPTFFDIPSFCKDLYSKVRAISGMPWGGNTNFQKVFDTILKRALEHKLPKNKMPERLYVLSDMQFDEAFRDSNVTNFEMVRAKYASAGYDMPEIIFWNLRSDTTKDFPVKFDERGVSLVSGFSPSILKYFMDGTELTPLSILQTILQDTRYAPIQPPLY